MSTDKPKQLWQPSAAESLTFDIDGQQYAALAWGNKSAPVLVAFHGWLDNAMSFAPLAQYLSASYRLIAFDWPGHGLSDWRPGSYPLQWTDYLLDIDRLLAALDCQPLAVIGHSLGAISAGAYAAICGDTLQQLILIEAFAPLSEEASHSRGRLQKSLRQHRKPRQREKHYVDLASLVSQRQQLTGLEPGWCELILDRNLGQDAQGRFWRIDPRLRWVSPVRMTDAQVQALMSPVRAPTLLISGTEGYKSLNDNVALAKAWYQALTLSQLAGHHHLHMENAAAVASAINSYLNGTKV
ncbi:alpha/beta hydrolase [Shewanella avicenniae]|uniref:Alpha/beta hydrolase n=1 Tax=Shewanella avicenniae TaxID=2814294 RepID=A0ABX7QL79_9GAMM|nr:alpha/beta hydrolase [Shewanella avicenniae]QSX32139.1 alpha/beta hydrolase [Shewanella avicenniae]